MKRIFFDTETNGLPFRYDVNFFDDPASWDPCRILQIAWQLYDDEKLVSENMHIIHPNGFEINPEAAEIHGITQERTEQQGISIETALNNFLNDFESSQMFVCHNVNFDMNVVGAEMQRAGIDCNSFLLKDNVCTMIETMYFVNLPGRYGKPKWPRLQELHHKLFQSYFSDAHDALADVSATAKCFFELLSREII